MKKTSLLRQLIDIHWEQAKRRKALRNLAKMEWSFEFLAEVVRTAAKEFQTGIEICIESKSGNKIYISSLKDKTDNLMADDDIFNHLDDNAAVERFIVEHSRRK